MVSVDIATLPAWIRALTAGEYDDDEPDGDLGRR